MAAAKDVSPASLRASCGIPPLGLCWLAGATSVVTRRDHGHHRAFCCSCQQVQRDGSHLLPPVQSLVLGDLLAARACSPARWGCWKGCQPQHL